ncbi:CitMHS family citrate-Mg2+:H+ or citrate-Ca2+:H+ symporter [Sinobaca qinghaiensis]|uniref:CitMHS family citrate-Mg2+:H+ or citrate-Ca2+:H+ symporter n=1 Tax=Sinobaca qinghaiensis TaxID=342944 RepID=A0A419V6N8_9BACL|nr:citrate:proton symporter [Sinobaca qinghaiensis]RKD75511.1 CitMHS family citrate-Mg2+:H+ or citrate-Ca2+:H+ symporter [Sinobaca qinghaiensis]
MTSLLGFITIFTIVTLLITKKISPVVALILIPVISALLLGTGAAELTGYFEDGIDAVISVVIMFIFAILFFGIMQDAGLFDPIIKKLVSLTRGNVIIVAMVTIAIAIIAGLDGSGASTFLITIPALLPLYKRLHMSPYLLMLLVVLSIGVMNLLPWAGPIGRAASVLNMDPVELWRPLIPLQLIEIGLLFIIGALFGWREKKRIEQKFGIEAYRESAAAVDVTAKEMTVHEEEREKLRRPKLLWINILLTAGVIGMLMSGFLPSGFVFMIGLAIALPLNYPKVDEQMDRIKAHAPNALMMAGIILAAGSFLGILEGTGMLDEMAGDIVNLLPAVFIPYLHIIIGLFGVPFDLVLSTDAYYFALVPIVEQIVSQAGVASTTIIYTLVIGNIIGTMVSPFAPALWLGLGLAGIEMGRHLRYSFFWVWGFSIILLGVAWMIGIIGV